MTALSVDDIATDADLADELGGSQKLDRAMRTTADRDAKRARALEDVLEELLTRSPPIAESDLADPTELKRAVVARALQLICRAATAVPGDTWHLLGTDYAREFRRYAALNFTVTGSLRGPGGFSIDLERR